MGELGPLTVAVGCSGLPPTAGTGVELGETVAFATGAAVAAAGLGWTRSGLVLRNRCKHTGNLARRWRYPHQRYGANHILRAPGCVVSDRLPCACAG